MVRRESAGVPVAGGSGDEVPTDRVRDSVAEDESGNCGEVLRYFFLEVPGLGGALQRFAGGVGGGDETLGVVPASSPAAV